MSSIVPIEAVPPYVQSIASSGQTQFDTDFTADDDADVVVYARADGATPDDITDLIDPADYTVSYVGVDEIVRVTFLVGRTLDDIVTIMRATPVERLNLYTNGNFTPSMLNGDFGKQTMMIQEREYSDNHLAPKYNNNATVVDVVDTILPILGANQFWAKNGVDTAIEAVDISAIIGGGTVTQINTGLGLTGGPITNAGTISFAQMAANTFWGNITGGVDLPTEVSTDYFLKSANNLSDLTSVSTAQINLGLEIGVDVQAYSDALTSIAGLTTTSNNLIYTTASDVYAALASVDNRSLVTDGSGTISWSDTLPQDVQTNIQYLGVQNQNLNMGGFQINNGAEPTQPSDFATKNYVDLNALTGTSVYAATTTNLNVIQAGSGVGATLTDASGTFAPLTLDGVAVPLNSDFLVKDLAAPQNEGIYKLTTNGDGLLTPWKGTRSTTYDTPSEINQTGLIIVQNGSTLAGTAWYNAGTIVTVDTTAFSYSQFGNITFPVSLAHGGTNANLTASEGSVVFSNSTALALSAVGNTGQLFRSAGTGTPTWTTATFAATYGASELLYSNGANTIIGLTTGNSGVLVTSAGGVPSISSTLPAGLTIPGYALSGANNDITSMSGLTGAISKPTSITMATGGSLRTDTGAGNTLLIQAYDVDGTSYTTFATLTANNTPTMDLASTVTIGGAGIATSGANANITSMTGLTGYLQAPVGIKDANGNIVLDCAATASAVNYMSLINNVTGSPPIFNSNGSDTNISIGWQSKGTGGYKFFGTATTAAYLDLYEDTDNGSNFFRFQSPSSITADRTASLPDSDISDWIIQRVSTQTGAVNTGSTVLPFDDTIPQNTEGDEYMTLAITPRNVNNILKIEITWIGTSSQTGVLTSALYQDATANALACATQQVTVAGTIQTIKFTHTMTAGTTSATTFKVRAGQQNAATTTFNGTGGARKYGGVLASSIVITETSS